MSNFQRSLFLLAAWSLGSLPMALVAQESAPPQPPPGNLLKSAPDYTQWTVDFSVPQSDSDTPTPPPAGQQYKPKQITTTKTGSIIHEQFVYGTGQTFDRWFIGQTLYLHDPASNQWMEAHPGQTGAGLGYNGLPANGFRDLDWINSSNYVGMVQHAGHQDLVFTQSHPSRGKSANLSPGLYQQWDTYALIDLSTHLPEEVKQLGAVGKYRFTDLPHQPQEMAPDLAKIIQQGQDIRAHLSQMPPRPY
jgi:hypothetical protein